jgi:hypothetical protein
MITLPNLIDEKIEDIESNAYISKITPSLVNSIKLQNLIDEEVRNLIEKIDDIESDGYISKLTPSMVNSIKLPNLIDEVINVTENNNIESNAYHTVDFAFFNDSEFIQCLVDISFHKFKFR